MLLQYELFVLEKEGEARHAHWVIFPKAAQQRSNIASSSATMYRADDLDPLIRTTTAAVNGETASGASNMRHVLQ